MTDYLNKIRFSEDNRKEWKRCYREALEDTPDKIHWTDSATGYHCLMHRGDSGVWCGYVAVDESHALYGRSSSGLHERELEDYFYQGVYEVIGRDYLPPNYYSSPINYTEYADTFLRYEDENKGLHQPQTFRENYWYIGFHGGEIHPSTSDNEERIIYDRNEWPRPKYWGQQQIFHAVKKLAAELKTLEHVNFKYFDSYVTKMKINDDYEEERRERESKREEQAEQRRLSEGYNTLSKRVRELEDIILDIEESTGQKLI